MRTPDLEVAESAAEIASRIQTILEKGKHKYEARYRNKDGSILDVEVSAQYLHIDGGRIVAFLSDITRRKQDEKELIKKNAEIEQFIYTVSHDLRSPLVTINTFLGFLEQDVAGNDQDRISQDVMFIKGATGKMKLLLDELLEMSRILGNAVWTADAAPLQPDADSLARTEDGYRVMRPADPDR